MESGFDSGLRNIGRLGLSLIPWALGVGAIAWLSFYAGAHAFRRELSQEKRRAEVVGAYPLPKQKINIVIRNARNQCRVVERAEIDSGSLWVYWRNHCGFSVSSSEIHWRAESPDGTVLVNGWNFNNWGSDVSPDQLSEFHEEFKPDPRVATIEVWVSAD